jgi:hypothetical protein
MTQFTHSRSLSLSLSHTHTHTYLCSYVSTHLNRPLCPQPSSHPPRRGPDRDSLGGFFAEADDACLLDVQGEPGSRWMGCDEFFPDAIGEESAFLRAPPPSRKHGQHKLPLLQQAPHKPRHPPPLHPNPIHLSTGLSSSATRCHLAAHTDMANTSLLVLE